ncbi:MAG TPA: cytochrome c maturation protein CcmE [Caulobacteraceae bacterium]
MSLYPKSRKARRRLTVLLVAAPILALAVGLSLYAMRDAVVFFYGPSEAKAKHLPAGRVVRIGGLVETGSVRRLPDGAMSFRIADHASDVSAVYKGELPDLFREGQGVVAQGAFNASGGFEASQVLAKHDERYMPKEVVQALKKSGEWRPSGQVAATPVGAAGAS